MSGMITKPPPNDRAPTLSAVHASAPSPARAGAGANGANRPADDRRGLRRATYSAAPDASNASATQAPTRAAVTTPAATYTAQRTSRARPSERARARLGT